MATVPKEKRSLVHWCSALGLATCAKEAIREMKRCSQGEGRSSCSSHVAIAWADAVLQAINLTVRPTFWTVLLHAGEWFDHIDILILSSTQENLIWDERGGKLNLQNKDVNAICFISPIQRLGERVDYLEKLLGESAEKHTQAAMFWWYELLHLQIFF